MIASQADSQATVPTERSVPNLPTDPPWTPLERFAFRFVFAYFAMFLTGSFFDSGQGPRTILTLLTDAPVRWVAQGVMHLPNSAMGSPRWALSQQIVAFAFAATIAAAWSVLSRRKSHPRLRGWFLIGLRYYVAIVMSVYGGLKVIQTQFPPISFAHLSEPLGNLNPMGLLWTFMGYSTLYAMFAGFGESLGAFLLFFRKTTTAGALILVTVLSNVALLNYTFDVPVKQLSSNLLFASIVLVSADIKRLADIFIFNRPSAAVDVSFDFRRRWIYKTRRVLKPIVIVLAVAGPLTVAALTRSQLTKQPPLYGLYDVDESVHAGGAVTSSDTSHWQRVAFDIGGNVMIRRADQSATYFTSTVDTVSRRITLRRRDRSRIAYSYRRPSADVLILWTANGADSVTATLHRVDPEKAFPLLRRR